MSKKKQNPKKYDEKLTIHGTFDDILDISILRDEKKKEKPKVDKTS